jgi:hypothetical protein
MSNPFSLSPDVFCIKIENVLWEARLFQGRVRVTEPSSGNDVRDACTMLAYNYVLSEGYDVTVT